MAAEILVELYRFDEEAGTYSASVTLVYERPIVYVKGLDNPLTVQNVRDLDAHVATRGARIMKYTRKGREKQRRIKRDSKPIRNCGCSRGQPYDHRQPSPTGDAVPD